MFAGKEKMPLAAGGVNAVVKDSSNST